MNKKTVGSKDAADKLVKNIRRKTARRYSAEEKIRIVLAVFVVKRVLPRCAVAKGSQKVCTTNGRRNFLRLANDSFLVTQRAKRQQQK